jgi:hypothetical protein
MWSPAAVSRRATPVLQTGPFTCPVAGLKLGWPAGFAPSPAAFTVRDAATTSWPTFGKRVDGGALMVDRSATPVSPQSTIHLKVASPPGLAPARPGLKDRPLGSLHSGTAEVRSAKCEGGSGKWPIPVPSDFQLQNWCSHVDSHHEPSPSHGDVQFSYTLGADGKWMEES